MNSQNLDVSSANGLLAVNARRASIRELDEITVDLRSLLQLLWRGKWILAISTLVAFVLALLAVSQLEPQYRATTKVMFGIQQSNVVNLQEVLVEQQYDSGKLEDQMQVLSSEALITRVIDVLKLDERREFNPNLRPDDTSIVGRIRSAVSLPDSIREPLTSLGFLRTPPPPPSATTAAERLQQQVFTNVLTGVRLTPIGRSHVIEVSYVSSNPNLSAHVANTIAKQYIVDQLEAKLEATRAATTWLTLRVDELRGRVEKSERAIENARERLSLQTGQTVEVTQQQLQALNGSLAEAHNESSRLRSLYDRLTDAVEQGRDLGAISEFRDSRIIQNFRELETGLASQRASLEATVPDNHPSLVRLDQRIEEIQVNINKEARRIVSAAEIDLSAAEAQESALIAEVRRLEQKALQQSKRQVELRQLDREAAASRVLYENFLARLQETTQQETLQEAEARILTAAKPPVGPETRKRNLILFAGIALGTLAGAAIILLLDRLNNTFRSPVQLEDVTGKTVLATLPALGNRLKRRAIVSHLRDKPGSGLAESVRNLRTSILFSNIDKPPKVVMFTSSVPREGKSTTSMLVAMTSKQMGKSAIIVDCDFRLPSLARMLEADDSRPGLMAVMEGTADVSEAIFRDKDSDLHVLTTKPSEHHGKINAADVLSSRRFHDLVRALSEAYDLVILDTPPVLVVTDARIISRLADAVIYAVRWDKTPRGAVIEGLRELESVNAPIAGLAMTMVNESRAAKYSYDGYGYYKGRYKDYYTT